MASLRDAILGLGQWIDGHQVPPVQIHGTTPHDSSKNHFFFFGYVTYYQKQYQIIFLFIAKPQVIIFKSGHNEVLLMITTKKCYFLDLIIMVLSTFV